MRILDELKAGQAPSEGAYDEALLREARAKGAPQMGTTRFEPETIILEFIYPEAHGTTLILAVRIVAPQRIVFLPVPEWVIESIWQGDIDGSYHFESDAERLVEAFRGQLTPEGNKFWFGPRQPKRRE